MDEYFLEIDAALDDVLRWIRAYLPGHPQPPWLDLGDRILWFGTESERQSFLDESEEERKRTLTFVPCLGWWNGELYLAAARDEVLDAAQHQLLTALHDVHPLRLLANGFHAVPIDDLVDPELYE